MYLTSYLFRHLRLLVLINCHLLYIEVLIGTLEELRLTTVLSCVACTEDHGVMISMVDLIRVFIMFDYKQLIFGWIMNSLE